MNTLIGCKLPNGITLNGTQGQGIELNGVNKSLVAGGFGLTYVDENEAAFLFAQYREFSPFVSKAIFSYETDKVADLVAMADDLKGEKTGFEAINPDVPAADKKLLPADEKQLDQAKEQAERNPVPVRAPASAADKAAAKEAKAIAGNS
jgi:hypothetical protein